MENKQKICGIYMIEAVSGNPEKVGWKYVGQSVDCWGRLDRHLRDLKRGVHKNLRLQSYYDKYGQGSLAISLLNSCSKQQLDLMERWFIKAFDCIKSGFNCLIGGKTTTQDKDFQKKSGALQNVTSGQIVSFRGLEDFAKENGISATHLSLVLSGKVKSIKGWVLPEEFQKLPVFYLKSPNGIIHPVRDFSLFCRENKIKNKSNIFALIRNRRKICEGWTLCEEAV